MRSFFSSSPKKSSKEKFPVQTLPPPPQLTHRLPENLARHLKPDGTMARAFISFKEIAPRCDTRLFETSYPLIGQRVEAGGKFSTLQAGEIVLQIFRLPPLPGIAPEQLPQSLEECHRGLRHVQWHKMTYFEGILTQSGGDCTVCHPSYHAMICILTEFTDMATSTIPRHRRQPRRVQRRDKAGSRIHRPPQSPPRRRPQRARPHPLLHHLLRLRRRRLTEPRRRIRIRRGRRGAQFPHRVPRRGGDRVFRG